MTDTVVPAIEADCTHGYSRRRLEEAMSAYQLSKFDDWMNGQTMMLCEGRKFNHDTKAYEPSECAASPHGAVAYSWDVERFLAGRPIVD